MKKYEESLEVYNYITKHFNEQQAIFGKGRVLMLLQRNDEALEAIDEYIKLKPSFKGAQLAKADCLLRLKRYGESEEVYKVMKAIFTF